MVGLQGGGSAREETKVDNDKPSGEIPEELKGFQKDFERAEKKVSGEVDPGMRAVALAALIVLTLLALFLPQTGSVNGWEVLANSGSAIEEGSAPTGRIFVWMVLIFGGLTGMLALLTRRWWLTLITAAGSAVSVFFAVLAVWSRQTISYSLTDAERAAQLVPEGELSGPGIGMYVLGVLMLVLAYNWVRVAWTKTALQLAAESERRNHAAEDEDAEYNQSRLGRPDRPRKN